MAFRGQKQDFFWYLRGWVLYRARGNVALAGLEIAGSGTVEILQMGNILVIRAGNWQWA